MTAPNMPVHLQTTPVQAATQTAKTGPDNVTAGNIAQSQGSLTTSTTISSLDQLKKKAPKLYKQMLEGIAMNICRDMKDHQERLKKLMREATNG